VPFIVLLFTTAFTSSWSASLLWWLHAVLLGLFAATLLVRNVSSQSIITWFLFSLIPHAGLAIVQFAAQHVWDSTLFGVAEQIA
jgi:hypothetical protein